MTDFSLHTVIEIEKCHQLHLWSPAGDLTWSHLFQKEEEEGKQMQRPDESIPLHDILPPLLLANT